MASINTVSIELELKGQQEVTRGLKNLAKAQEGLDRGIKASVDSNNKNAKSLDRIMREAQKAQREMDRLSKAVQKGTITQSQFLGEANKISARLKSLGMANAQSEVMRYYSSLTRASAGSKMLSTATSELTKEMNRLNVAQSAAGSTYIPQTKRQTSQLGVVFQQAGYQVGDFAVQVQSGTHYMVALGQQLTQLVGVGAMLSKSTKWIAAFSLAGVIVPIATAIAGAFMRVNEEANGAKNSVESLDEALNRLNTAVDTQKMSIIELVDKYGVLAVQIREAQAASAEFAAQEAFLNLRESEALASEFFQKINAGFTALEAAQRGVFEPLLQQAENPLQIVEQRFARMADSIGLTQDQAINLGSALKAFETAGDLEGKARASANLAIAMSQIPEEVRLANRELFEAIKKVTDLAETGAEAARSLEVLSESAPGSGWMDNAIKGVNGLFNRVVAAIRQVEILKAESSDRPAGFKTRPRAAPPLIDEEAYAAGRPPSTRPIARGEIDLTTGTVGGGTSGAGAAGPNIAEEFERLKRSIDDAYEASQKFKESKDVLDRAMASGVIKTTEEYNRLLGLLREEYDLTSEKGDTFADNMMKIAQTARDALGDAFMSIVDGTKSAKDAFADMARIILKQAFELLVIKPILDGIFGGLTGGGGGGFLSFLVNANGNAFSGGNVIPFANGGVVGGPMAFPMSGGRMGLMGEAGPEAIMPLKRGKGGKLGVVAEGSSQPVVINQSFNFQANGDDSVKRIIAQEAPKIANLTQKQIMDQRRRGGAMKATFG